MANLKEQFTGIKNSNIQLAGVLILILLAVLLMWINHTDNTQAMSAMVAQVRFYGEYRIGDGEWQEIIEGEHIPATQGDVTLRGNFHMLTPYGEHVGIYDGDLPIAFFINHINLAFYEGDHEPYIMDIENPLFGESTCGVYWNAYYPMVGNDDPVEIRIHNPHCYGNDSAIDEMLSNVALWSGIDFERGVMEAGQTERNVGLFFVIVAFVLLGSALFSALLHLPNHKVIWLLGLTVLFAGSYMIYSDAGVSLWSERISVNTSALGISMMLYMLFVTAIIAGYLKRTKKIGNITTVSLGIANGICFLLPTLTNVYFYDTWMFWVMTQSVANLLLIFCLILEWRLSSKKERAIRAGMAFLLLGFEADVVATAWGYAEVGTISEYVFLILFVAALFVVLRIIPNSINAAERAKELEVQRSRLEAELKESRVSIMLSQIQPHFIYNTLGTIERMCLKDPEKAFQLVRNFSLYLRGNFSELDSVTPIRFSDELKHVEYYANIEKVRFPDMTIEYDVETTDFVLPALSVQPLVENAIKHGLMRLESGGTVVIRSYETLTHFCVEVKDDGVGFDISLPIEEKKHVGLRNIRGRLQAMVNGELTIESKPGAGTRAVIMIPKE